MEAELKQTKIILQIEIENGTSWGRGKSRAIESMEIFHLSEFSFRKLGDDEYELTFKYEDDADLEEQIYDLYSELQSRADDKNCSLQCYFREIGSDRQWD
ncbi:MAG: hypothetical protein EOO52_13135 [Gammaproteobacteria bacterium]|nr:MAG: hypothetical protein EOO52_13135 [Gammaproteobacteria bacterium]